MAIYKVVTPAVFPGIDAAQAKATGIGGVVHVRYAASSGAAKHHRMDLMEAFNLKRADIDITEADVHKGKAGLIEFLNAFHAQVPASYRPVGYAKALTMNTRPTREKVKPAAKKPAKK